MAAAKTPAKRKATKTRARKVAAPKQVTAETPDYNSPQWAVKVETYLKLKELGLSIPNDLKSEVETWIAAQEKAEAAAATARANAQAELTKENEEGPKWVRNLYGSTFCLRLQRQDKKQRIELQPRGMRGDMFPLEPGDENDHLLLSNIGFVEVIGNGEARKITEGQTHNIQKTNSTLAMITNELGEPINKLTVETEFNSQGVVVGYIDPNARPKDAFGGIVRPGQVQQQPEQVSHFVPNGGHPTTVSQGPLTDTAKLAVADKLARIKGLQGRPEEVLGLTVSVDPVRSA